MLAAAGVFWLLGAVMQVTNSQIILLFGLLTLAGTVYIVLRVPDFFIRFTLWMLTHTIYRITIVGRPNIPLRGAALIVVEPRVGHRRRPRRRVAAAVRALHGLRPVLPSAGRQLASAPHARHPRHGGQPARSRCAVDRARAELAAGHVVCIFAEGAISRTGNLLPFQRGFERILKGLDVPILPVYLDRVWGSVFSFKRGRFFWKFPERLPYPVTVALGMPLPSTATAAEVRQAISELGSNAMSIRRETGARLHVEFMRSARRRWKHLAIADTTGQKLTYGRALIGAFAFGRVLERRTPGESAVGTLLPASAGAVLANIGLFIAGRLPVNLNFTIGREHSISRSGSRASRPFSRRGNFSRRRASRRCREWHSSRICARR